MITSSSNKFHLWWNSLTRKQQKLIVKHNKKLKKKIQVMLIEDFDILDYITIKTLCSSYRDYLDKLLVKERNEAKKQQIKQEIRYLPK